MTLADMRALGVHRLIATCLNNACRHTALMEVSYFPADTPVLYFARKAKCSKCGAKRVDVQPNWKEQPTQPSLTGKQWT